MKSFFITLIFVLLTTILLSQNPPDTLWTNTYGGYNSDRAYSVQQISDGGFIIVGSTSSIGMGSSDFWLLKTNDLGNEEWSQTYGGNHSDIAYSGQETSDNGFIITGYTTITDTTSSDEDILLVKTDINGNEVWSLTYGGSRSDKAYSVQQTNDNGYVITGYVTVSDTISLRKDICLLKFDEYGEEEWTQIYGGYEDDVSYSVQQISDGGFIIVGSTSSFGMGGSDFWLIKTDELGNEEWSQTYGGNDDDVAYSVQQTSDNGFIIAGYTKSYGNSEENIWVIKIDENGYEEWNQTFGGNGHDIAYSVRESTDGGFIIAGNTSFLGGGGYHYDYWIIKTDEDGGEIWDQTFGDYEDDIARSVQETTDGSYIIAGYTNSYGAGNSDCWLICLTSDTESENETIPINSKFLSNYPNPFNPTTKINFEIKEGETGILTIYNIKGQLIESKQFESGQRNYLWDASKQSSGIYLYKLKTESTIETRKMLLLK